MTSSARRGFWPVLWWCWLSCTPSLWASSPPAAAKYQRPFIANVRTVWGLSAPIAVMAAQVHKESSWRPDARSAYASGLAQFTPDTADWIAQKYPDLQAKTPFEPAWAFRALARYDKYLYDRADSFATTACSKWSFALSGYNGGSGWLERDRQLAAARGADPSIWFGQVEKHSARSVAAFLENRQYVHQIILEYQKYYLSWGPGVSC